MSKGHPDRLLVGYDSDGRACGKDSLEDYPYVYLTAVSNIKKSICLKTCPSSEINNEFITADANTRENTADASWAKMDYVDTPGALVKTGYIALNVASYKKHESSINKDDKHVAVYQTKGYFKRVCLPYGKY